MLKKTVRALRAHPFARVQFPGREKMREYAAMVQAREPLVDDIIGFMDGFLSQPSALTIVSTKTQCIAAMIATQW